MPSAKMLANNSREQVSRGSKADREDEGHGGNVMI